MTDLYNTIKDRANKTITEASAKARDIANDFPPFNSINWKRRNKAEKDLLFFLETYFPNAFNLKWSADHIEIISKIQTAILEGGLFCLACPRGTGKTSITERAAIWAILFGHRPFVCLIGATQYAAEQLLAHIKSELGFNELLLVDFPTTCYPLARLEGNSKRCIGQTYQGNRTLITWTSDRLVLPTIARKDTKASGSVISCCGLTGNVRGQIHTKPDGTSIRPSFVMCDDPQTRESASSGSQTEQRLAIILGDVLGLAGPTTSISCVMPCTVIYRDDLADRLLDKAKHPQWNGSRTKLLYTLPSNDKLWDKYKYIRDDSFRQGGNGSEATEFYKLNQAEMDVGAKAAWEDRFNSDEISAIQHGMNLLYRDSVAFHAEYQNEPEYAASTEQDLPSPTAIIERVNNYNKGLIPSNTRYITAYIDCSQSVLWWAVMAFEQDFTSYLIDYGAFPDQKRDYFTLSQVKYTLQTLLPGAGIEGQLYNGLSKLTDMLMGKKFKEDNGTERHIDRLLIDSGWQTSTVFKFCRETPYARNIMPSKGIGIGAAKKPYSEYRKVKGDILGHHWRIPPSNKKTVRGIHIDTNYWKSFVFQCLGISPGDRGALTLYGNKPQLHRMWADQICAEQCVRVSAFNRTIDEWKEKHGKPDNHFFDTTVGCFVGASLCGCQFLAPVLPTKSTQKFQHTQKKSKVSYISM